jgi:hypothetical protein
VAAAAPNPERAAALRLFAANLHKAFYAFEPDFFQHNLLRIVDDAVSVIKGSLQLWPTLVEICYFQKGRKGLPMTRVNNRDKSLGHATPRRQAIERTPTSTSHGPVGEPP